MSVAYLGVPGTFSHEASLTFVPDGVPIGKPSFAQVVDALRSGEVDFAVLPTENNQAGPVREVQQLLGQDGLRIVSEHVLPVRMHLLGLPDSSLNAVTTAVSHHMALRQCSRALAQLGLAQEEADSTATAAKELTDPNKAALASEAAAKVYGLTILAPDVQDNRNNATTFVVLARSER